MHTHVWVLLCAIIKMSDIYISSRANPNVVKFCSLQTKKGRTENGLFLCEGLKLCKEALGRAVVLNALIRESSDNKEIRNTAEMSGGEVILLSDSAFDKISSDMSPDGIIFVCKIPQSDFDISENEHIFALECVRDPGNVGTIIRTAAAFGMDRVILANCADLYNSKTVKSTMGAVFKLRFTVCNKFSDVSDVLKSQGRRIISAALNEKSAVLSKTTLLSNDCLIVGNEGHGISDETLSLSDETLIIPMSDKTESLNAASASTVLLWEISKSFENL